jgi:hypothetical protein
LIHGENSSSQHGRDPHDLALIDLDDLVGRTFLMDVQEDGQRFRARIVECIFNYETDVLRSDVHHKFCISVNKNEYKETITYNQLLDFIQKNEENDEIVWRFKRIVGHQGPLLWHDTDYNGSKFNVLVEWENGEITCL